MALFWPCRGARENRESLGYYHDPIKPPQFFDHQGSSRPTEFIDVLVVPLCIIEIVGGNEIIVSFQNVIFAFEEVARHLISLLAVHIARHPELKVPER